VNSYGPTEATIVATRYEVKAEEESEGEIAIGRVIENVQVYVLDEQQRAVPVGVWGELYIGGAGVGRGYWGQAEQTAERFVPNRYGSGGERVYRSGDVCRYRNDGELEYGWRVDEQVKVRGQRVELGEIEAALKEQAGVQGAVVRALRAGEGEQKIVAYVVRQGGVELSLNELRRRLGERLPAYMMPAAMVFLDHFPLTPSFKIDYRALPPPQQHDYQAEKGFVAPRSPVEEKLAQIWRDVLKIDRVGIHENFFELGGHSLLATRLISQVRKAFQTELPVRAVFEAPTVELFARQIQAAPAPPELVESIPIVPRGKRNLEQLLTELDGLSAEEVRSASYTKY
jgi:acyl carrier protein